MTSRRIIKREPEARQTFINAWEVIATSCGIKTEQHRDVLLDFIRADRQRIEDLLDFLHEKYPQ